MNPWALIPTSFANPIDTISIMVFNTNIIIRNFSLKLLLCLDFCNEICVLNIQIYHNTSKKFLSILDQSLTPNTPRLKIAILKTNTIVNFKVGLSILILKSFQACSQNKGRDISLPTPDPPPGRDIPHSRDPPPPPRKEHIPSSKLTIFFFFRYSHKFSYTFNRIFLILSESDFLQEIYRIVEQKSLCKIRLFYIFSAFIVTFFSTKY